MITWNFSQFNAQSATETKISLFFSVEDSNDPENEETEESVENVSKVEDLLQTYHSPLNFITSSS